MRKLMSLAVAGTAIAGLLSIAAPAQAVPPALKCTTVSNVTYCELVPGRAPRVGTATTFSLSANPALRTNTVRLTGSVHNLLSGANGSLAGTARVFWKRAISPGPDGIFGDVASTTSVDESADDVYTPSALLATLPVSASGAFGMNIKALHSGKIQVRYSGNASTVSTNGRRSSTSGYRMFTVLNPAVTALSVTSPVRSTNFQTPRFITDPNRPVTVRASLMCSSPEHNLRISLTSPGRVTQGPITSNPNDTVFTRTVTFGRTNGTNAPGYVAAIRVQTNSNCVATVTATQQATVF